MIIEQTPLKDCFIIHNNVFLDDRGYFFESFNQQTFFKQTGLNLNFVQDNQSKSTYGVLRGMHYQLGEFAQAKLVRVLEGSVIDVAVDCRKSSPTYGKSFSIELTQNNNKQLFIPRGFAHGFVVNSPTAVFFYKCDNFYNKQSEAGFIYNDTTIKIDWQIDTKDVLLSDKDRVLPSFAQASLIF
jgi:dTDP-4-dehydrorhamnose 3,5-epimerase